MGTLFRQTPNNGYPFPPKWPLKMGTGLEASAAHPRPNNIWVPPPPRGRQGVAGGIAPYGFGPLLPPLPLSAFFRAGAELSETFCRLPPP